MFNLSIQTDGSWRMINTRWPVILSGLFCLLGNELKIKTNKSSFLLCVNYYTFIIALISFNDTRYNIGTYTADHILANLSIQIFPHKSLHINICTQSSPHKYLHKPICSSCYISNFVKTEIYRFWNITIAPIKIFR